VFQDGLIETISSGSRRRKATSILERRDPSVLDTACRCPAIHRPKREASSTEHPFPAPSEPTLTRTENTKGTVTKTAPEHEPARHWTPSLPFQQLQALFNSLFKVLCIFPSRYLFAIGLSPLFSFRWNLPPTLNCTPKQFDSTKAGRTCCARTTDGTVTLYGTVLSRTLMPRRRH
jgi:hypothetical protein